jgi:O-glycosyl hydrolase
VSRSSRRTIRVAVAASAVILSGSAFAVAYQAAPALAADSASISGSTTYQTIAGFGFAEAFGEAADVMNAPSPEQQQALNLLLSTSSGAGLDIIRNEISADSGTTIEPNSPGSPSAAPTYVSLASIDQDQGQLWFDQQAKANYGVTNFFADAWSAPAFMKTNGSQDNGGEVCGVSGTSCGSGDWRQAYANYLVQYAEDYAAAGVPLSYIGPTNEPDFSASYDSMTMSGSQLASLLDVVGPTVKNSGLSTQVECCAATGWPNSASYASAIEADPTALADTAVFSSHGYSGAPTTPLAGWAKPVWETEWFGNDSSSWDPAWDDGTADSGLTWAQHIYQGLTGANLSAFLFWQGADPNNGNGGLVYLNNGTATASGRLWAFANYSRYIRPGAVRIASTSSNSGVDISAYKNTDGTIAVVVLNTLSSSDTINYTTSGIGGTSGTVTPWLTNASNSVAAQSAISLSSGAFSATVPARSLVTYVIKPSNTVGNTVTVTSPGSQTGTVGTPVSVQVQASDSASGQTLTYSAVDLPAGLSINSATGLISGTPTTAGTSSVMVTATDGTGASGSATFNWAVSGGGGGGSGGSCHVAYTTNSQWPGGFTAQVVITNTGTSAISSWSLVFTFPGDQKLTQNYNGGFSQSGETATLTNASYNGAIAVNGSVTVGFQGTWTNSDAAPTAFTLNGTACT